MAVPQYREGDWFAVPLGRGGFAIGVVARAHPKGALVGYFFGPKRDAAPPLSEIATYVPEDAVLVGKFGHLGIRCGEWPLLGRLEDWDREVWAMPIFVRYEELTGRSFHVFYDPDDPARLLREQQIPPGAAEQGPRDGLMGAGYIEEALTTMLG